MNALALPPDGSPGVFHRLDVPAHHQSRAETGLEPEEQDLLRNDLFE
jgi:hypothetical protein